MRRRGVEVEVIFLDILAMVALVTGQAEGALLEDRIDAVPQRERQAEALLAVADAAHAVLAPAIGARAGLVVVEILPGSPAGAVILAHRSPGALGEIGAPQAPVLPALMLRLEAAPFRIHPRSPSGGLCDGALGQAGDPLQPDPRFECAGNGPGLGRAAARRVWLGAVDDFGDSPDASVEQVVADRRQPVESMLRVVRDAVLGKRVVAQEPRPGRSL